jgi:hypothetical protein
LRQSSPMYSVKTPSLLSFDAIAICVKPVYGLLG